MARSSFININDVKFDLLKIIEPWDGVLAQEQSSPVYHLFNSYLGDLRKFGKIKEYQINSINRDTAITYDISVKFSIDRSPNSKSMLVHSSIHGQLQRSKLENGH
ncbi:MAG: hypothetical protein ACKVJK_18930 [Methylophagaceae bacterium]